MLDCLCSRRVFAPTLSRGRKWTSAIHKKHVCCIPLKTDTYARKLSIEYPTHSPGTPLGESSLKDYIAELLAYALLPTLFATLYRLCKAIGALVRRHRQLRAVNPGGSVENSGYVTICADAVVLCRWPANSMCPELRSRNADTTGRARMIRR